MTATADKAPPGAPDDHYGPLMSQSVAGIFAVFGLAASLGMGWMLARSTAGMPPFQLPSKATTTTAGRAEPAMVHVVASDLKFDATRLQVAGPGPVNLMLENKGLIDHDLTIEGAKVTLPARPGKTAEKTITLDRAGTYTFYCSLPGHREAGMQGTLVVGDGKSGATSAKTTTATTAGTTGATGQAAPAADQHVSHATTAQAEQHGLQEVQPTIEGDTKVFNLAAQVVQWEVIPGVKQEAWTYNGQLPGPVIRVTEGDKLRVNLTNNLPEATVLHFHGPDLPNAMDGVPDVTQPTIPVGGTYSYEFTATPAGTYMYHSHHDSQVQETKGLYGILIIDPKPGSAEAKRDAGYQRDYLQVISEFSGYYLVNGHSFPATDVLTAKAGEKVRIRLVNLGQMAHPMHLHGFHFKIVGTDGIPVEGPPLVKDTVLIGPGERYDLEVVPDKPGLWIFHCHILSHVQNDGVEPGGMLTVLKVEPA